MSNQGHWVTTNIEDKEIKYSFEAHRPKKLCKTIPWLYCAHCGLLYLKNPIIIIVSRRYSISYNQEIRIY